jgi:hypothetical protein
MNSIGAVSTWGRDEGIPLDFQRDYSMEEPPHLAQDYQFEIGNLAGGLTR